ncbi:hypothetical protein CEXT_648121 [Caerostris extrusa]|uniref:Uncharacterized protein n=1 Tax=Caerostris extrusa TaxID=172846 RepID=A0AAV4UDT7_CAEEX|nr:hypothetical protein CEXT_648121 [Caerostris extrusa]
MLMRLRRVASSGELQLLHRWGRKDPSVMPPTTVSKTIKLLCFLHPAIELNLLRRALVPYLAPSDSSPLWNPFKDEMVSPEMRYFRASILQLRLFYRFAH